MIPDISKWNISNPECFKTLSFNSNSISIKEIKSDSILSNDIMNNFDLSKDLSSLNDNYNENIDSSNDEELDDYYDNFYN